MDENKILKRKRRAEIEKNNSLLLCACTDLAELYLKQGQYELAIGEYETIAEIHDTDGKAIEYAKAHRAIGEAYMGMHNFVKALEHQKKYLNIALKEKDVLEQQRAYATMGHMYLSHYLETQMDSDKNLNAAYKYFMKSLVIAESLTGIHKLEKADMLARLFSNLGLVKESMGDYRKASELLNRSITICKQHDIYEQLCRGYTSMASLYDKRGDFNETIHHYNLAIDAAKKLKGKVDLMCGALLSKAEVLIKLTDFHGAKHVLVKAYRLKTLNINERKAIERSLRTVATMCHIEDKLVVFCEDDKERKKLYEKMGDCACALKNYSKAIEYYKLMLKFAEKCGISGRELAACYYSLAETYKDNNQYAEAEEYFEREYPLCENLKDNLNTLSKIADTKEAAGDPVSDVKAVYERALNNCRTNGNLKEERRMLTRLINYLRRVGNHSDAFDSEKYLNSLDEPDVNDKSTSSSGSGSDQSDSKGDTEYDLDLDGITDDSGDSDFEQKPMAETSTGVGKRKHRHFVVKKNAKGESQLHVACITGKIPVVRHLLDQGHPVNVRDNSGWLPLHEACNHGYTEIVGMLLDKGAAINDRGGTQCEGITPIYDAANNGHVNIVKLLLERGASAIVKTDNGDTPLNVLKMWHRKNPFVGEDLELYHQLVRRMSEAMEKVGEKVDAMDVTIADSLESMETADDVGRSENREVGEEDVDLDEPDRSQISEDERSNSPYDVSASFSKMTKNIGHPKPTFRRVFTKKQALVPQVHSLDDWLEDDIQHNRLAKKRRTTLNDSSISSSAWPQERRNSKSPRAFERTPQKRTSNDFENSDNSDVEVVTQPARNERLSFGATQNTNKRTFSRYGSKSSSSKITQYLRKAPSFGDNSARQSSWSFVEADSTTPQSSRAVECDASQNGFGASQVVSATPPTVDLMVFVDVKIESKVFRVPVWMSQLQTNTIGWLAEEAAQKYARKECSKPRLELETTTGALLSDDDPLSLLFPLGATKAEPVIGRILELSLPSLIERYKEACTHTKAATNASVIEAIEETSVRLTLENKALPSSALTPLCMALNHQASLLELNLSANFLDANCITKLCSSLPSLLNLTTLCLRCTGLVGAQLGALAKVLPALEKLSELDLSDNFLRSRSLRFLSELTQRLKLAKLSLSNVGLTSIDASLDLRGLRFLDVSDNRLDTGGVARFVSWTSPAVLSELNVSRNVGSNEGVLASVIDHLQGSERIALESLNVSRCNLQENELYGLLRLCSGKSIKKLDLSYNSNLTGISLRRLLECSTLREMNLIGCENIFQYFDDCGDCDLLQGTEDGAEKVLKLSADMSVHSPQIQILTEAFKKLNSDAQVETGDAVILRSSKKGGNRF